MANSAPTFSVGGGVTINFSSGDDLASSVALDPDGRIVVVGDDDNGAGFRDFAVARLTKEGLGDTSFGGTGIVVTDFTSAPPSRDDHGRGVAVQSDHKVIVGGYSASGGF